jgi:hypothetical protein
MFAAQEPTLPSWPDESDDGQNASTRYEEFRGWSGSNVCGARKYLGTYQAHPSNRSSVPCML